MGYGFCLSSNCFDQYGLKLGAIPLSTTQLSIREKQASYQTTINNSTPDHAFFYIRSSNHITKGYPNAVSELRPFPPGLLDIFAILVANRREMTLLSHNPNIDWTSNDKIITSIGWRSVFAIMSQLLMALRRKRDAITSHNALLPREPKSQHQRYAKIYRDGQLDILRETIQGLETGLKKATSQPVQEDLFPAKLLTLEKAFKTLKAISPEAYREFKSRLRNMVGTSSVSELREAGWEEDVFMFWICVLRDIQPADHPPLANLTAWLNTDIPDDDDYDEDKTERINHLLSLIQDTTSTSSTRITTSSLRQAINIVEEQGFTLVLDDRDELVGAQYVLCLV